MERISSQGNPSTRVLRVPPSFGLFESKKLANTQSEELAIIDVFQRRGFRIERGGQPDFDNPLEIGIHARASSNVPRARDMELAQETSIEADPEIGVPRRYRAFSEILDTPDPLVAKWAGHGGKGKFLLRTEEDKARFLAVAAIGNFLWPLLRGSGRDVKIQKLLEKVKERNFEDLIFEKDLLYYTVEEYIQQPTEYNTSYRIVADAYGNIHYGLFLFKKRKNTIQKNYSDVGVLESALRRGGNSFDLLMHPKSPLYIPSPDIISNHLGGSEKIRLRGEKVANPLHRRILKAHGIDPDDPQIPRALVEAAKKIGQKARYDYPFVGIDFLLQRGKKGKPRYYFLEANAGAAVSAFNLDFSEAFNDASDMHVEMMRRVVSCVPSDAEVNECAAREDISCVTLPEM